MGLRIKKNSGNFFSRLSSVSVPKDTANLTQGYLLPIDPIEKTSGQLLQTTPQQPSLEMIDTHISAIASSKAVGTRLRTALRLVETGHHNTSAHLGASNPQKISTMASEFTQSILNQTYGRPTESSRTQVDRPKCDESKQFIILSLLR